MGVLKDSCEKSSCAEDLAMLNQLKTWAENELTEKVGDIGNPPGVKYILMTDSSIDVDDSWDVIKVEKGSEYLVPENRKDYLILQLYLLMTMDSIGLIYLFPRKIH